MGGRREAKNIKLGFRVSKAWYRLSPVVFIAEGSSLFFCYFLAVLSEARAEIDRKHFQDIWLQVDGGISLETIDIAFKAGADTFVAGSAVFRDKSPGEMVAKLRAKIS